jgi:hypothetical protein
MEMAWSRYEKIKNPKETGDPFKNFKKVTYYECSEVNILLSNLAEYGYECNQLKEGCLGCGYLICEPPSNEYKWVVIREVPMNCWSSGHRISYYKKLCKTDEANLMAFREGRYGAC